jgi:anti-sigma factor RsiW
MACSEMVELVTAYLDGVLSAADRGRFEAHLAECDDCTVYVAQFSQTLDALRALPGDEPDPASVDALLEAFRALAHEHEAR